MEGLVGFSCKIVSFVGRVSNPFAAPDESPIPKKGLVPRLGLLGC